MPQEGKRSIGYRPFITCDDPRGVVECGTVKRKEAQSPTTYHLLEVSRGAQKLSHVVSSWSCGHNNNNERDMAKDLLKGALDLGESLAMLSRLQDAKNAYSDPSSEEACCDDRKPDSSDAPSTSSSQSSIVHSRKLVSPESFVSSAASKRKKRPKGFNLIAKLMGLEDASLRKHVGYGERIVNQKKPAFDVDSPSPRARKDEHDPWKLGWKRRTLDQMIEALKFKGNLKSPPSSRHSESSNAKERSGGGNRDHWPPIVIMKSSRFSCLNMDHPIIPKPRAEVDEEMLLKMNIRTNPLAETDEFGKLNFHEKELLDRSPKGKASSQGKSRPQKKQSVEKNAEEAAQKVNGSRRRGEKKRTTKSESHLQSIDGDESTNLMPKSSRATNDTLIDMLQSGTTNTESVTKEAIPFLNGNQRDKDCEMESPLSLEDSTTLAEDASQTEITDYVDDDQSSPSESTPLSSSNNQESQCSTGDIMPVRGENASSEDEKHLYSVCGTEEEVNYVRVISTPYVGENKLKALLLSSPQFLNHVEELFDMNENPDRDLLQEIGNDIDRNDLNGRMLLDCANEIVELHSSECCRACLLLPLTHKMSCVSCYYTSLDQLVDEVCDGIEALKCYIKDDGDGHSTDNLLLLVKGDLRSGKMVTGVWDIGWRNAGSAGEIEEITRGVDELVLDELIEEILVDLTL